MVIVPFFLGLWLGVPSSYFSVILSLGFQSREHETVEDALGSSVVQSIGTPVSAGIGCT